LSSQSQQNFVTLFSARARVAGPEGVEPPGGPDSERCEHRARKREARNRQSKISAVWNAFDQVLDRRHAAIHRYHESASIARPDAQAALSRLHKCCGTSLLPLHLSFIHKGPPLH
jgi:hypothetical protein